ncbi:hypothetical protein LTR36_002926 [Oleoguttula mirabilis]|uniref:Uncharacterized protein n=1 Tax=Oleoguttula mirabilis TaxID=1507867 RepID=A0AAV9JJW4_9PEZI|nr:hypothetical protein LTR36_002926 [Oleoguttula mirabilis]
MTSPFVYISLQTATATDACGRVGGHYSGSVLTLNPTDVSTVYGAQGAGYVPDQALRINYADLQGVVPASVPTLAIPPQVRSLDPAWAACALDLNGLYDPPTALTAAQTIALPTVPSVYSSTDRTTAAASATPSSSPTHSLAQSTSTPTALPDSASTIESSSQSSHLATQASESHESTGDTVSSSVQAVTNPSSTALSASPATESPSASESASTLPESVAAFSQPPSASAGQDTSSTDPQETSQSTFSNDAAVTTSATTGVGGIIASVLGLTRSSASADAVTSNSGNDDPSDPTSAAVSTQQYSSPNGALGAGPSTAISPANPEEPSTTELGAATSAIPSTQSAAIVLGTSTVTADSDGQYSLASGFTLAPGSVATVSGTTVSLAQSGDYAVINGETTPVASRASTAAPSSLQLTVGDQVYTQESSSAYVIAEQTLSPGSAITVSGTTVSLVQSGGYAVVNGETTSVSLGASTLPLSPQITVGTQIYTQDSSSLYVIECQTLSPGSVIVVSGTTMSLDSSADQAVVDGITQTVGCAAGITTSPGVYVADGQTYTQGTSAVLVIVGNTLSAGSQTVISGTTYSLAQSGTALVVDGTTKALENASSQPSAAVLTFDSETLTEGIDSAFTLGGQTLHAGSAVTVSGTTLSFDSSGSVVVVNGVTHPLSAPVATAPTLLTASATVRSTVTSTKSACSAGLPASGSEGGQIASASSTASSAASGKLHGLSWLSLLAFPSVFYLAQQV